MLKNKTQIILLSLCALMAHNADAQNVFKSIKGAFQTSKDISKDTKSQNQEIDIYNLTLVENLELIKTGKYSPAIVKYQKQKASKINQDLKKVLYDELISEYKWDKSDELNKELNSGVFKVELTRNQEVILVTFLSSELFKPNEVQLTQRGVKYLTSLLRYLDEEDMYRMLLDMHTDNTATDEYNYKLSELRVKSIFDWFEDQKINTDYVIPYASGGDNPILPNNSMENREQNRRLEIFLVPGKTMVEKAKKSNL